MNIKIKKEIIWYLDTQLDGAEIIERFKRNVVRFMLNNDETSKEVTSMEMAFAFDDTDESFQFWRQLSKGYEQYIEDLELVRERDRLEEKVRQLASKIELI